MKQLIQYFGLFALLTILFGFQQSSTANNSLEILLKKGQITTCVFDSTIVFVSASHTTDYLSFQQLENKLMLIAQTDFKEGHLMVELMGGEIYSLPISVHDQGNTPFIDLRTEPKKPNLISQKPNSSIREVENHKSLKSAETIERVDKRMSRFLKEPDAIFNKKHESEDADMKLSLKAIKSDEDHLYIRLLIENGQAMVYELDYYQFVYESVQKKRLFGQDDVYSVDVFPTVEKTTTEVAPFDKAYLNLAIPVYGLDKKGYLRFFLKEKNGFRDFEIKLTSKQLQQLLER